MTRLGRLYLCALKGTIAVLFAVLIVVAFYQVVSRYALGVTPSWAEEAARYLAIWTVLLTSALAIELKAHISVDLFPKSLPRRGQLSVVAFGWVAVFSFLFVFLWQSFNLLALAEGQITPGLGVPMAYIYWILPLAGCCMIISSVRAVSEFVRYDLRGLPRDTGGSLTP